MADKNGPPYISVIVTAYDRKSFLPYAIESLANQDIDFGEFELIILSNFDIEESMIRSFKVRGGNLKILKIDGPIGYYFEKALEISSGAVLCFLDDDDLFASNKLNVVKDIFTNNERLGYISNYMDAIDENGAEYRTRSKIGNIFKKRRGEKTVINNNSDYRLIRKFIDLRGNALNSTISIRKSILLNYKSVLRYVLRTEDEIIFAIALDSGYDLMLISLKLTSYRISNMNSSRINFNGGNTLRNRCYVIEKELSTFHNILNAENLFKKPITRKYLTDSYSFDYLLYTSICSKRQKENNMLNLIKRLAIPLKTSNFLLILLYFLSRIHRDIAVRFYLIFRGD
jgi:glycosyltransferase involved in cell wall biosynthesis